MCPVARGWLLTGEPAFLAPYDSGTRQVARGDRQLRAALHGGDPGLLLGLEQAQRTWMVQWATGARQAPPQTGGGHAEAVAITLAVVALVGGSGMFAIAGSVGAWRVLRRADLAWYRAL